MAQIHGTISAGDNAGFLDSGCWDSAELTVKVRGSDATTPIPGASVVVQQLEYPKMKHDDFWPTPKDR